jgi:alkylation response protein AidB-like acyl-CoA dehydrogenase
MRIRYPLPEEYKLLYDSVKRLAEALEPELLELDRIGHEEVVGKARRLIKESSKIRLLSLPIPVEFGGSGYFTLGATVALEALAFHDAGFATSIGATWLGLLPVLIASMTGNPDVGDLWLKPFTEADARGDPQIWGFAITEPTAGSDYERLEPRAPQPELLTYARREGEYWVVSGRKVFISNAPIADFITVFAITDKALGVKSMACFVIPTRTEGFRIGSVFDKMGHRSSPTGEILLESVRVPSPNLVCPPGTGWDVVQLTLAYSRAPVGGIALGVAKRAYWEAAKYASARVQGGLRIIEHQIIREKLANMYTLILATEALIYSTSQRLEKEFPPSLEDSSAAKVFASNVAVNVALEAIQVMGGYGYMRDFIVEKLLRDAKLTQIYEGTNEINLLTISDKIVEEVGSIGS